MKNIILIICFILSVCGVWANCIDMSNLHAPNITCTYGTTENPYQNIGVVDHGSNSGLSRHTIHTNTQETDYIINQLKTIPPGENMSIRLGNWSIGGEAESITFEFAVTSEKPLLLLKYAGVMENPGHSPAEQPRLKLDVMDTNGKLIDSICNCFDFIAASNLGWNNSYGILWKDWTNIGVNLIDYIGMTIKVRLTSYDCSQMGHFGYSYIHLSCANQTISTTACGTDVVLEAPKGYEYNWYKIIHGVSSTIGSGSSITVPMNGDIYYCDCQQIGKPSCFFTISHKAIATPRFPIADFSIYQLTGCTDTLYLTNTSSISQNGTDKVNPIIPCDSAVWVMDDGRHFNQYDISSIPITFSTTGKHTITLTTYLTKGNCYSTVTKSVFVHGYNDLHSSYIETNICEGEFYNYNGHKLYKDSTYKFIIPTSYGCDSIVTLRVITHPRYETIDTITLCDGEEINYHGIKINSSGRYEVNFHSVYGCDSIFKAIVYRSNSYHLEYEASICEGDIYDFGGRLLQKPGVYWDSATTYCGCDSITKLTLTIRPSYLMPTYVEVCHDQTFLFRGKELDAPGIYYDTLLTHQGCDSIYMLVFNKAPIYLFQDTVTICEGSSYNFRGRTIREAGFYYDTLQSVMGCDSIYQLLLQVAPMHRINIDTFLCGDSYNFRGRILTASGLYYDTIKTGCGCDSIYALSLNLNHSYLYQEYVEQCEGDYFEFRGRRISEPGVYYDSLYSTSGCDSVYQLVYNKTPTYLFEHKDTVCSNMTYHYRGKDYTRPGIYADTLQTVSGCDSVFRLILYHNPSYYMLSVDTVAQCSGKAFFRGKEITESGVYSDSLQTICGCDSIYALYAVINKSYLFDEVAHICDYEQYTYRGKEYMESGIYIDSLQTIAGCDSIYRLFLDVTETIKDTIVDTICIGDAYQFAGMSIENAGLYMDTINDPLGQTCRITILKLGSKAASSITDIHIQPICADNGFYQLCFRYNGTKPYTYSIYYDKVAQEHGFRDVINRPFVDTIYAPVPQYKYRDYVHPDYYSGRLEFDNGVCSPKMYGKDYRFLIQYPSWVIRQHWNDVVAILNAENNGGYYFEQYDWVVNGRVITSADNTYSNLYMPELKVGDEVSVYLTRRGENYAIPTCPIIICDMSSLEQSTFPVLIYPNMVSKSNARIRIQSNSNGIYRLIDIQGRTCDYGTFEEDEYINLELLECGIYFMNFQLDTGTSCTRKIIIY